MEGLKRKKNEKNDINIGRTKILRQNLFISFIVSSQALNTFLKPFLCFFDLLMLRLVCSDLRQIIQIKKAKEKKRDLLNECLKCGYFDLAKPIGERFYPGRDIVKSEYISSVAYSPQDYQTQREMCILLVSVIYGKNGLLITRDELKLMDDIIKNGVVCQNLDILKIFSEYKDMRRHFDKSELKLIALKNKLFEILDWHEMKFKYFIHSMKHGMELAKDGNLESLKWMKKHGYILNSEVFEISCEKTIEQVDWCIKNVQFVDLKKGLEIAEKAGKADIVLFLKEKLNQQ